MFPRLRLLALCLQLRSAELSVLKAVFFLLDWLESQVLQRTIKKHVVQTQLCGFKGKY